MFFEIMNRVGTQTRWVRTMIRHRTIFALHQAICCTATSLICISPLIASTNEASGGDLRKAVEMWKQQQARVEGAVLNYEVTIETATRQRLSPEQMKDLMLKRAKQSETSFDIFMPFEFDLGPAVDDTYTETFMLSGTSGACRIKSNQPIFDPKKSRLVPATSETAFDGDGQSRRLFRSERDDTPLGQVERLGARNLDVQVSAYKPIFFALRGLNASFIGTPTLAEYSPTPTRPKASNDGAQHKLESSSLIHLTSGRYEILVDANKDYALVKYLVKLRGNVFRAVEVSAYKQHDKVRVPAKWACTYFDFFGNPESTVRYDLVGCAINPQLGKSDFQLQFPPQTTIDNQSASKLCIP